MSSLKFPYDSGETNGSEISAGTGIGSISATRSPLINTADQAQQQYVNLVKDIPEVVKVLLVEGDGGQSLLTVISATPFDDGPRKRVLDTQVDLMRRMERPLLGFHLVNTQELPGQSLERQGLEAGVVLWSR